MPAPTSFDLDPICRTCTPRREISQRQHFAWLVSGLLAAEITIMGVILGRDGIAQMCRWVGDMVTPW
ncbi:hypothetical protein [Streptomyces sp. NPDC059256]|uniref:hypothetical protein n=1 Tax=Streptomyces sp. NPDC059256 TaxID=3346794 RepID=UPI003698BA72